MPHDDLTITDVLEDPLIRLMMRADRVTVKMMKTLLTDAARAQAAAIEQTVAIEIEERPHQRALRPEKAICSAQPSRRSNPGGILSAFVRG